MSKLSYAELDEYIDRVVPTVKLAETNTTIFQLINGQISRREAISKIYLENMERLPTTEKRRYKTHRH